MHFLLVGDDMKETKDTDLLNVMVMLRTSSTWGHITG